MTKSQEQWTFLEECWAEEGGVRVRIEGRDSFRRIVFVLPNGHVSATIANFRQARLAKALVWEKSDD